MSANDPSIWCVSDGRAGNAAQCSAIEGALRSPERLARLAALRGEIGQTETLTLSPRAPWTWWPGTGWPLPIWALPEAQRAVFTPPWPFLWLAAGRRSAPYTRLVRRRSQEATFTVQILDPKTDPSAFDLVIAPEHDGLTGTNVIRTVGSPSHFSTDRLNTARHTFAHLESVSEKSAIVILGGNSKTHTFTQQACKRITTALEHLANEGWHLRLTTSRRTPHSVTAALRQTAERIGAAFWANEADGPNPYLGWLLHSQVALVTEDSANMLCDAAWHGLPVHMLRLEGRSTKFDRLHTSLIERSCARWFDGTLENWGYPPLREADRVADAIIDALLVKAGVHGG